MIKVKNDYWVCKNCHSLNPTEYDACQNCYQDASFRYEFKMTRAELKARSKAIRNDLF